MTLATSRLAPLCGILLIAAAGARAAEPDQAALAQKAHAVLKTNCYRCHGQDGAVEGGFNFVLDRDKLVARRKIVPGKPEESPLLQRIAKGKMPPPDEQPRPSAADVDLLKRWIEMGAPTGIVAAKRQALSETAVMGFILEDLERIDRRQRRFTRYFTLSHLYNAGLSEDELQTYRHALSKLVNSLSWHPRNAVPEPIDPAKLVLRIDLRNYMWDANLWNRLLTEYPYGILQDTAVARACSIATGTRLPVLRADWFLASASRPPLYHELLQLPTSLAELERQLRVDVAVNLQQERVARAGFNGSGVAKNNRLLERHDAVHGAYWRTYDFDAVPQNLIERDQLLPDRRNLFAYPLGPGNFDNPFQHAGGEVIWNLPNGLQAYLLVNANNVRVDKAPTAIVSDPKRPDRAVETGISCMGCHYRGINPKDDQVRDFTLKNPKAFSKKDTELILSLYPPQKKMQALMDEDMERFQKAVAKTGARISVYEPIMTMTLRYEADVDLLTAAAEAGLEPEAFLARVGGTEAVARNLGALKAPGGTVSRQVLIQAFGDIVRELRLGVPFQPGLVAQSLPDNTGEIDPLEGISSQANSMAFAPDGRRAVFASADKTVRLWDVEANREVRRFIGHTASVWAVAFSADGRQALSGSADQTVRLWDVETGREIARLAGHEGLVTCVAFAPDGRRAVSAGYDHSVILWDLEKRREVRRFTALSRYLNCVTISPDGRRALVGGDRALHLIDLESGEEVRSLKGHRQAIVCAAFSADGRRALSGSDDGTLRLWDLESGQEVRTLPAQPLPVKSVAFSADGRQALSGGADQTVRLWDLDNGTEVRRFTRHREPVIQAVFLPNGQTLSGSRDSVIQVWNYGKPAPVIEPKRPVQVPIAPAEGTLRPSAVLPNVGLVSHLTLSPDGRFLYYLKGPDGKLGRVETWPFRLDGELKIAAGTEAMCPSPDGKLLYAAAAVAGKPEGSVQVIDALKMELTKVIGVSTAPFDIAANDQGLVFLSGAGGDWTDISVLDTKREAVAARWSGVWRRSFLKLSPTQDRLYVSTQGVSPGSVETWLLSRELGDKPASYPTPARGKQPLGGEVTISPDGKHLFSRSGAVLRLASARDEDLQHAADLGPFLSAAIDPDRSAVYLLTSAGTLKVCSYPDFKPRGEFRLGVVAYQATLDRKQARLYLAAFDPKALAERPRNPQLGSLYAIDLNDLK